MLFIIAPATVQLESSTRFANNTLDPISLRSQPKQFRPAILVDLVVISTLKALIAEEVDVFVVDAAQGLLGLDVLEAEGFVPAGGEDVEGDLAAY